MSIAYYDPEPGPAFDAIERAINQTLVRPPGYDKLFSNTGLIGVDWDRVKHCHHSNEPIVAAIAGMIDDSAAESAMNSMFKASYSYRLADAVGKVSSMDENQFKVFLAAAGHAGRPRDPQAFTEAVNTLIDTEDLGAYFERGPNAGHSHQDIRPFGYAESWDQPGTPSALEKVKAKADRERLPKDKRVALLIVLALYNEYDTRELFKGRGWAFHGVELGRWLKERFHSNERSARAALTALGQYCYW